MPGAGVVSGFGVGSVIALSVGFLPPGIRLGLHGDELMRRQALDIGQVLQPDIARALVEQEPRCIVHAAAEYAESNWKLRPMLAALGLTENR